ncbi:hypothetical protein FBR02_00085 [Anaerolineae bacterium CFX9]|nr:hypothetical protein [Anaerolineae bacterium]MDL1899150.1 hypothetical protein [Anaerolineae bacterium CFX9]NOG48740.1 hypothetical protein [Chloroflexota bacterium]GIK76125.1 MAG: hypothetical protein BroJett021_51130 [Chloroflexota bacterium]
MTEQNQNASSRVFKIGATRIVEDPSMSDLTNEQVRDLLKTSYPEIANATLRERTEGENGLRVVEFLPQPGRKG